MCAALANIINRTQPACEERKKKSLTGFLPLPRLLQLWLHERQEAVSKIPVFSWFQASLGSL